jgi:hypothetical protein
MCGDGEGLPRFQIKPDVNETMAQMMAALMGRVPRGTGQGGVGGAGTGSGGSGSDGFSMAGESTRVPMYGPDRLNFSAASGMSGRDGRSGATRPRDDTERAASSVNPDTHRDTPDARLLPDTIPAKYRDAVKRYFTPDTNVPPQN